MRQVVRLGRFRRQDRESLADFARWFLQKPVLNKPCEGPCGQIVERSVVEGRILCNACAYKEDLQRLVAYWKGRPPLAKARPAAKKPRGRILFRIGNRLRRAA